MSASTAAPLLRHTATAGGNIAAMSATSPRVSVAAMTEADFKKEKLYQATMHIARRMLAQNLISPQDYRRVDEIFLAKYRPLLY